MTNPGLTRPQWIGLLALLVAIFLFVEGPIWRHPWNVDRAAWFSYLPIPLLVGTALAWKKRLRWPAFVVDTIGMTSAKFAVTYLVSIALWIASGGPPPRPALAATAFAVRARRPAVRPRPSARETGVVEGRVVPARKGAIVWIEGGLETYRFPVADDPVRIVHDDRLRPERAVVEVGQRLELASSDGRLHTFHGIRANGRVAFNVPVLPGGAARPFVPREASGLVRVDCTVHAGEPPAWLVVTGNPSTR